MRRLALTIAGAALLLPGVPALGNSAPPAVGCSWSSNSDPDAVNAAYPDTNATYWFTPYAATPGTKLVIRGIYPKARYFSFHVYHPGGVPVGSLYDAQIAPNRGSANPFAGRPTRVGRSYTVTVLFTPEPALPAANTIYASSSGVGTAPNPGGQLMLRVYVPTDPRSPAGGVPLPTVTTETTKGTVIIAGAACSGALPAAGGAVNNALIGNSFPAQSPTADLTAAISWSRAYGNPYAGLYGNEQNAYLTASISRRFGDLVVIHAKAPLFPNTRAGVQPYVRNDVRYWSICQNSNSTRVNSCAADFQAHVRRGLFTYVISDPSQRPRNADASHGVVWLPWGAADATALLIYRNMLVSPTFRHAVQDVKQGQDPKRIMGAYYPSAVYCDKATFERGGWQGCFYRQ